MGFVQSVSANATTGTAVTGTLGIATTAGNCVFATVGESQDTTNPTVASITLGGSADNWAASVSVHNNAECNSEIWADPGCAGAATAVAVTFNAGTGTNLGYALTAIEWSGITPTTPLDKTSSGGSSTGTATTYSTGATGTLGQATEVVISVVMAELPATSGTITITGPTGSFTDLTQVSPRTFLAAKTGYQAVTSTASITGTGAFAASIYGACIASYKQTTPVTGTVAVAQAPLSIAVSGATAVTGSVAVAQAPLTIAAAGGVAVTGSIAVAQAPLKISASGATAVTGTVAVSQAPLSIAVAGTITPRKLLVSLASQSGSDDYGNAFPAGVQVGAAADGPQVQLLPNVAGAAQVAFPIPGQPVTPPNIAGGWNGAEGILEMSGPQSTAAGYMDWAQILLFSNGGGGAIAVFNLIDTTGAVHTIATYSAGGWNFYGTINISGSLFVNGTPIT
jgi:hypothetical protein